MRRATSLLLIMLMLVSFLAGCGGTTTASTEATKTETQKSVPSTKPETTAASTEPETTEAGPSREISWATAFQDDTLSEGVLTEDCIAFLQNKNDGTVQVFNASKEEIRAWRPEYLPRTRYFEQYMPQTLIDELLPVLDYAMAHGCGRVCVPTTEFETAAMEQAADYLSQSYFAAGGTIKAVSVADLPGENGEKPLHVLLISVGSMDAQGNGELYLEALDAAKAVVDALPQGLDEYGKMYQLYCWLTKNVKQNDSVEHADGVVMLHDALVLHSASDAAAYTKALYVLCNLAGIDCFSIDGYVGNDQRDWNVARINGTYYQFDAAMDTEYTPAEFGCYGMSASYSMENHTKSLSSFANEYCPDCPADLLPAYYLPYRGENADLFILVFYMYCNARDYDPVLLFQQLGWEEEDVHADEPEDGWIHTSISMPEFMDRLLIVMAPEQIEKFVNSEPFSTDRGDKVMVRVPKEDQSLSRLVDLEENEDGTWTAYVVEMAPDGVFTARKDRVSLEKYDWWLVAGVEIGVE